MKELWFWLWVKGFLLPGTLECHFEIFVLSFKVRVNKRTERMFLKNLKVVKKLIRGTVAQREKYA